MSTGFKTGHQYDDPQMPVREAPMPGFKQPPREPYVYSKLTPEAPAPLAAGVELRRWQDEIRAVVIKESGAPPCDIDGGGCDSGDPLDLTLAEIRQGFRHLKELSEAPAPLAKVLHDEVMKVNLPDAASTDEANRHRAGVLRKNIADMILSHPLLQGPAGEATCELSDEESWLLKWSLQATRECYGLDRRDQLEALYERFHLRESAAPAPEVPRG